MLVIRNLNQPPLRIPPLALTIGNFDGVHFGHLQIIAEVKKIAEQKNLASAILTFEPHPLLLLRPQMARDFRISSLSQKLKIFASQKIDYAIILPFNQNLAAISANDFIQKILVESLNIKHLTIGHDFIFGQNREGNFQLLAKESEKFRFGLNRISEVKFSERNCSSSMIRRLISAGEVVLANRLLEKNFAVCGIVNEGKKLASQLGFPTMNVRAKPFMIKPKFGVYKSTTFVPFLGKKFFSITNFGTRPTVNEGAQPCFETHLLDFSQKIYGKKIFIELLEFIREEKKFNSLEELRKQIECDISSTGLMQ